MYVALINYNRRNSGCKHKMMVVVCLHQTNKSLLQGQTPISKFESKITSYYSSYTCGISVTNKAQISVRFFTGRNLVRNFYIIFH